MLPTSGTRLLETIIKHLDILYHLQKKPNADNQFRLIKGGAGNIRRHRAGPRICAPARDKPSPT
jgi:hypothetical protein